MSDTITLQPMVATPSGAWVPSRHYPRQTMTAAEFLATLADTAQQLPTPGGAVTAYKSLGWEPWLMIEAGQHKPDD